MIGFIIILLDKTQIKIILIVQFQLQQLHQHILVLIILKDLCFIAYLAVLHYQLFL